MDSRKVREPMKTALPCNLQSWEISIMEMGIVSELPVANRSDSGSFCGAGNAQARRIPSRTVGGGRRRGVSF